MRRATTPARRLGARLALAVACLAATDSTRAVTTAADAASAAQAASASSAAPAASGASAGELGAPSQAEQLIFMREQLTSIKEPRTIAYNYVAEGGGKPRSSDHATLVLARKDERCCSTHVDFLSGPMAVVLPDLDDPRGNPVLMYFLESEVRLLERSTHGQSSHFRRRIRQAFADDATVTDTTARFEGRDVPAHVVHIAPFLTEPYRARYEHEATTTYDIVLSDGVPGGLVRISAVVPAKAGDASPRTERSLVIADPQPATPARK